MATLKSTALAAALGIQRGTGNPPEQSAPSQPQKRSPPGPLTQLGTRNAEEDGEDNVLPGLRPSLKAWLPTSLHTGSEAALAGPPALLQHLLRETTWLWQSDNACTDAAWATLSSMWSRLAQAAVRAMGQMRSTHGQPWPDNATWPLEPDEPLADHPGQGETPHAPMPMPSAASGAAAGSTCAPTNTPAAQSSATDAPAVAAPDGGVLIRRGISVPATRWLLLREAAEPGQPQPLGHHSAACRVAHQRVCIHSSLAVSITVTLSS